MFVTIFATLQWLVRTAVLRVLPLEKWQGRVARQLTPSELFMRHAASVGALRLCYVYFVDYNDVTLVSRERIERCLRVLMRRHPLLRARIAKRRGRYYWYEPANLRPRLRVDLDTDWRSVMLASTPELIDDVDCGNETDGGHPLWWVQFLPSVTSSPRDDSCSNHGAFLLHFHHAIADAQGIRQYHLHLNVCYV